MTKSRNSTNEILVLSMLFMLTGCGNNTSSTDEQKVALYTESNNSATSTGAGSSVEEIEGPQYQQPTMDVLKGKPQLFPMKYPVKRYPHATVAMVDVRPNRGPGYKNMVMLKTADQMPQISSYYKENLLLDNWKLVDSYHNQCYESTHWVKGDQECEIRISPDLRTPDKKYVQLLTGLRAKKIHKPS